MADANKEAIVALTNGVSYLIDNGFSTRATQIYTGIITAVDYGENTYSLTINGNIYTNIPTLTSEKLTPNMAVKVVVPQGQYNQMIILGYIH